MHVNDFETRSEEFKELGMLISELTISSLSGLIQEAVRTADGLGVSPLKRFG